MQRLPHFFSTANKAPSCNFPEEDADDSAFREARQAQLALAAALGSLPAGEDTSAIEAAQANVERDLREHQRLAAIEAANREAARARSSSRVRAAASAVRRSGRRSPQRRARRACGPPRASSGEGGDPPPRPRSPSFSGGRHVPR